ncbi:MAG: MupG family TIM beta-alpha barrel fold protein [Solobacterium sp.]|nr:MupG family TIM beta-alpha barrel fold protein [Solobacterium sp.]
MKQFGISVYPEHTTKEKVYEYMRKAGALGFRRVFTCFLSVTESKEDTVKNFKEFCDVAHEAGLTVSADTNPEVFKKLGARPRDLSVFKEIGLDIIRLDGHFGETEDIAITRNPYGIMIEYNASGSIDMEHLIRSGADAENMCACSNFYPQRHTGMSLKRYMELASIYRKAGLRVASFVGSQEKDTFGPWPVFDGLVTLEMHRDLPIDLQARHLSAIGLAQDIMIGNCFASDEELEALKNCDLTKIMMKAVPESDITETEREIMQWNRHAQRDDGNEQIVRSTWPRVEFKGRPIPARKRADRMVHRGDILIVNDLLEHYRGELWVVREEFEAEDCYNLVGHLAENEEILLDWIKPRYEWGLILK